jgi:hypothetical protein
MRNPAPLAALALSACAAAAPAGDPVHGPTGHACRPDGLDRFVGQPASQALGAEMQRVSGARILQWVGHGMMVTMDFSPERLRVFLTADNRVERASCG